MKVMVIGVVLVAGACDSSKEPTASAATASNSNNVATAAPAPAPAAPAPPAPAPPPIEVTAKQLFADYDANEISADEKYKGKPVRVTGTISSIGKDVLGDPYVQFAAGNAVFGVQCMFGDGSALASLKKGQELTVGCWAPGKMGNVILRGCVIIPKEAQAVLKGQAGTKAGTKVTATPAARERYASKMAAESGERVTVDGVALVLTTEETSKCDGFSDFLLTTQIKRLRGLGFREVRCQYVGGFRGKSSAFID